MTKKSNAQIARMKRRAEARGETYIPPKQEESTEPAPNVKSNNTKKLAAAKKLSKELQRIEKTEDLKAKDRRSAKRKAEAIAQEESGCKAEELLEWYKEQGDSDDKASKDSTNNNKGETKEKGRSGTDPCIIFIGQLSYDTTKEELFNYVKEELGKEHKVTQQTVQIRLLTDAKTKKSRGMAFLETTDPELMYACLKLHHTDLKGRRLNVERSAGGNKSSETRKAKLKQYREDQGQFLSETVDKMIADFKKAGELQDNELDDGVIALCKRHSAATVESTLTRYLETNGRDMDNSSAYFTHLIGKIATEGVFEDQFDKKSSGKAGGGGNQKQHSDGPRKRRQPPTQTETENGAVGNKLMKTSRFSVRGVDMSISEGNSTDFAKIFPSMNRGRGRSGRGYM